MKKLLFKFSVLLLSTCCFSSCSKTTIRRKNYLSGHYLLTDAATIKDGTPIYDPYFAKIKKIEKVKNKFDLNNSVFNFHVKVENGKAIGYGDYTIAAKENLFENITGNFEYYCKFTNVYGEALVMSEETKPEYFGRQQYRKPDWWFRTEIKIPEISSDIILLEFTFKEAFESPEEFNHQVW